MLFFSVVSLSSSCCAVAAWCLRQACFLFMLHVLSLHCGYALLGMPICINVSICVHKYGCCGHMMIQRMGI